MSGYEASIDFVNRFYYCGICLGHAWHLWKNKVIHAWTIWSMSSCWCLNVWASAVKKVFIKLLNCFRSLFHFIFPIFLRYQSLNAPFPGRQSIGGGGGDSCLGSLYQPLKFCQLFSFHPVYIFFFQKTYCKENTAWSRCTN